MARPASSNKFRVITYIDGFNLYFGLREQGWRKYMWLDLPALSRSLLRADQTLLLTKYFTSRVSGNPGKEQRQSAWLDAIGTLPDLSIYWGKFQTDRKECKKCHNVTFVPQEKKTDVNIATELLCDAYSDAFDTAIIISGDADLVPPIAAIRRLFPQKKIVVAFPPCRYSTELVLTANASMRIFESYFRKSRLPENVTLASGTVVTRPPKWA
ncbi:MAG: NYN domain-containing protein [Terracidiphilus sp.]